MVSRAAPTVMIHKNTMKEEKTHVQISTYNFRGIMWFSVTVISYGGL